MPRPKTQVNDMEAVFASLRSGDLEAHAAGWSGLNFKLQGGWRPSTRELETIRNLYLAQKATASDEMMKVMDEVIEQITELENIEAVKRRAEKATLSKAKGRRASRKSAKGAPAKKGLPSRRTVVANDGAVPACMPPNSLPEWFWRPFFAHPSRLLHLVGTKLKDQEAALAVTAEYLNKTNFPLLEHLGIARGEFLRTITADSRAVAFQARLFEYFDDAPAAKRYLPKEAQYRDNGIVAAQWNPQSRPDENFHYLCRYLAPQVPLRRLTARRQGNTLTDHAVVQRFITDHGTETAVAIMWGPTFVGSDFAIRWAGKELFARDLNGEPIPLPSEKQIKRKDIKLLEAKFAVQTEYRGQYDLPARLTEAEVRINNRWQWYSDEKVWKIATPKTIVCVLPVGQSPTPANFKTSVWLDGRRVQFQSNKDAWPLFAALCVCADGAGHGEIPLQDLLDVRRKVCAVEPIDSDELRGQLARLKEHHLCRALTVADDVCRLDSEVLLVEEKPLLDGPQSPAE
jgi:hypothetical protein